MNNSKNVRLSRASAALDIPIKELNKEAADLAFAKGTARVIYKHLDAYFKIVEIAKRKGFSREDVLAILEKSTSSDVSAGT
jgi:SOS response regulatory protein OraA/RecX